MNRFNNDRLYSKSFLFIKQFSKLLVLFMVLPFMESCRQPGQIDFTGATGEVKLIILNPGHFHAYLVQKTMYDQVNPTVHVYAPEGPEVEQYLSMIESYNARDENPTSWNQVVYTGSDYLEKMVKEKKGNVVILAGNNKLKTEYIKRAVDEGFHVLSDKPMAINSGNFGLLKEAFNAASDNDVLLYDIMTGRYNVNRLIQMEIMNLPEVFGGLKEGGPDNPSVYIESVHYFFKYVSGSILRRPAWYFDVKQQGEGLVDITTHLVDNVQWAFFPDQIIDYETDIDVISARRWATPITRSQFESITGFSSFPDYLNEYLENDTVIHVYANGELNYRLRNIHVKLDVLWGYVAPEGGGDTSYSVFKGNNANVVIRQGAEQNFQSILYIEPINQGTIDDFEKVLMKEFPKVQQKYPGIELKKLDGSWEVIVPDMHRIGHEAEFAEVTKKYLRYLVDGEMPDWEVPNMISKYFTTTRALEVAKGAE